jgi:multidrug efflux system membrane fusion protein
MHFSRTCNWKHIVKHAAWTLATVFCAVLLGCSDPESSADQTVETARPVKTMVVNTAAYSKTRSFPGVVKAARETELAFRVSGPLVEFDIRIGQHLKRGDVIGRIDPRDFEVKLMRVSAALDEAHANLKAMQKGARAEDLARLEAERKAAESRLADAQKNFERQKNLLADRATSKVLYDNAKTALDTAGAGLEVVVQELKKARKGARNEDIEAARARIKSLSTELTAAQNALSDTTLSAPFNGYINNKFAEAHENIAAGRPVVSFLDYSSVEVKTSVPEDIIVGQDQILDTFCTLESYPGRHINATIKEIGRKTDASNQSYPMRVVLHPAEGLTVESGMAATVHLVLKIDAHTSAGIALPTSALVSDSDGNPGVWRIDPHEMRVHKVKVTTSAIQQDTILITSGVTDGDLLATAGSRFLREGQKVRVLNETTKE